MVDPFSSNANFPAMTSLSTNQAPAASAASSRPPLSVPGAISVSSFGDAFATLSSRPAPTPAAPAIVSAHPVPAAVKGQLILKCTFVVFKSSEKPTKFFPGFLP